MIKRFKVEASKKSVKASAQDGNFDKSFKLKGTTYYIELLHDGGNYIAKWWDSSDNGLGYNNKGWVAIEGKNYRRLNDIEEVTAENIMDLLGIISDYDRKPGKPVQDRIKREVAKLVDFDEINAACGGKKGVKAATRRVVRASKADGDDMTLTFITPDLPAANMVAEKAWEIGGFGSTWSENSWVYIDVPSTQSIDNIEDLIDYAQSNGVYLNTKSANELDKWLGLVDAACGKKSVKSSKQFGVKASAAAKRRAKKRVMASTAAKKRRAIKASGITDDIVIYFNGDNVYQGSIYDMTESIENLCYDDEVNAKFQEWCNQFGDPFDFDGSPIDTAAVFTDLIIHEADEAPVSEDGKSEFYVDGNGILDFEIFYADDIYGASKKSVKCAEDDEEEFIVKWFYDDKFRDLAGDEEFTDLSDAESCAHEHLDEFCVTISHPEAGTVYINPDKYWDNFDGEFACLPEIAEWQNDVWKSMGIGAATAVKASVDSEYDEDVRVLTDEYITDHYPLYVTVSHVTYEDESDWSVDLFADVEMVTHDFRWFIIDNDPELYDRIQDAVSMYDVISGNDYQFQLYPAQNQWSAPSIDIDKKVLDKYGADPDIYNELVKLLSQYKDQYIDALQNANYRMSDFLAGFDSEIDAATAVKCTSEYHMYGYDADGADFTTDTVYSQDDVPEAIEGLFAWPEVDTVDLYDGNFDGEFLGTFTREDYERTGKIVPDWGVDVTAEKVSTIKAAVYSETDTQVLGELDEYIQNNYPIYVSVDTVDYRDENDWAVDIFADGLMVDSDFQFFLNENNSYLYNRLSEAGLLSNTRAGNIVMGEDFSFQFYENQNEWRAPTITIDKRLLKKYDADGSIFSELADQINAFKAQYKNALQEINYHLGSFLAEYDAKVVASTDITAAIGTESDVTDDEYNNALADEALSILHKDGYEDVTVSAEQDAISFFWNNEVVYVQPTNEITPNLADIYNDSKELSDAVRAALDEKMMDKYDADNQALAFSEDVDDLNYITGEEDYGFGFDSNGDPVDESTVEELERIAQDMVHKSGIAAVDQYADLHNFNYYASMPYVQESFDISFQLIADYYTLNNYGFILPDSTMWSTDSEYTLPFNVRVKNGEVEYVETPDPYERRSWGTVDEDILRKLDTDAMTEWAKNLVAPVAKEIYITTSNI